MEVCEVCSIEKHGEIFKTKRDRQSETSSSKDFVKTRICQYAKKQGRINQGGEINKSLAYNNLGAKVDDWLDVVRLGLR